MPSKVDTLRNAESSHGKLKNKDSIRVITSHKMNSITPKELDKSGSSKIITKSPRFNLIHTYI